LKGATDEVDAEQAESRAKGRILALARSSSRRFHTLRYTISEGVAPNTPATFSNPPAASIYDLSGVTRDFVAGSVVIGP